MLLPQDRNVAMLDELVGPADPHHWSANHLRMEVLHDCATESVIQDMVLKRANYLHAASKKLQGPSINRFDPPRVDERDGDPLCFQFVRGFLGQLKHIAEA